MTLRELILSVNEEDYSDSALFQTLRTLKPEYGSNRHIAVKLVNGEVSMKMPLVIFPANFLCLVIMTVLVRGVVSS